MNERELQLELPFDSEVIPPQEAAPSQPFQVIALDAVRLQRHAERVYRELVAEGFVVTA